MSSSSNRYDANNPEFAGLSNVGVAAGDEWHYTSPQGKAIRKKQKIDHVHRARREHRKQMEPIHQLLLKRGGGKKAANPPKRPKARIRRKSTTPPVDRKHNFCQSKKLRNAAPTSIKPSAVCFSFSISIFLLCLF